MPTPLYPLRFQPLLRRYLWGGRRLETSLGKGLGPGNDWAESWEICDHGDDQSRVALGPLRGMPLGELVRGGAPSCWAGIIRSRVFRSC
jgi:mannose-6-phosphate isomerase